MPESVLLLFNTSLSREKPVLSVLTDGVFFTVNPAPSNVLLATVDFMAVYDANSLTQPPRLFELPVVPGSMKLTGKWNDLPRSFGFQLDTRCFLLGIDDGGSDVADNNATLRATVVISPDGGLNQLVRFDSIQWMDDSKSDLQLPLAQIGNLNKFTSTVHQAPPLLLRKLGIQKLTDNDQEWTIETSFGLAGSAADLPFHVEFKTLNLPLEDTVQRLVPFAMSFGTELFPRNKEIDRAVLSLVQRPANRAEEAAASITCPHWIVTANIPCGNVLDSWNSEVVAPYIESLHTVQDGQPVSLLPNLSADETSQVQMWEASFSIADNNRIPGYQLGQMKFRVAPAVQGSPWPQPPVATPQRAVTESIFVIGRSVQPASGITCIGSAAGPALLAEDGSSVQWRCALMRQTTDPGPGFSFSVRHLKSIGNPQVVRAGSLDLVFPGAQGASADPYDATDPQPTVRGYFRPANDDNGDIIPDLPRVAVNQLKLALLKVLPGGQDMLPGEEYSALAEEGSEEAYNSAFARRPPLVIDLGRDASIQQVPADPIFFLQASEVAADNRSQSLRLKVLKTTLEQNDTVDLLVLDPQPMLAARVKLGNLQALLKEAITTEFATWSNTTSAGSAWEIGVGSTAFDLYLPSQAVGEAMEKGTLDDGYNDINVDANDPSKIQPLDFRFSPAANFKLHSSPVVTQYSEVPWNLRRILGYAGQRAPGAPLDSMQFELLYGMTCTVDAPLLQLAELSSRIGDPPGRQYPLLPWKAAKPQQALYTKFRADWAAAYSQVLSRLSILEPWRPTQQQLLLTEGLSYSLRSTAHLRYPVPFADPKGVPNYVPNDPNGLAGSFAWAFESANIYDAVWKNPVSVSAQLSNPYFSMLGGSGYQKASFDRGLTTIYSNTAIGRAFYISIVRIGRISVLWNRAKHVIVYERAVLPSLQFADEQDRLQGFPVLRKVREYVEILEPVRHYPEFGSPVHARGFVLGSEFPLHSRVIPVNSRWGQDVGQPDATGNLTGTGWKVPLWIRNASPAAVYPKPQLNLQLAADDKGTSTNAVLEEPDKLYFYTSTDSSLPADPDQWPAVPSLDYGFSQDLHQPGQSPPSDPSGTPYASPLPEDAVPAGYGDFTFAISPPPRAVNLVADRAAGSIGAVVRNVTIHRGPRQSLPNAKPEELAAHRLKDHIANALSTALAAVPIDTTVAADLKKLTGTLTTLNAAAAPWIANLSGDLQTVHTALANDSAELCQDVQSRIDKLFALGQSVLLNRIDLFRTTLIADIPTAVETGFTIDDWRYDAKEAIRGNFEDLELSLESSAGTMNELAARIDDALDAVQGVKTQLQKAIQDLLDQLDQLSNDDLINNTLSVAAQALDGSQTVGFEAAETVRIWLGSRTDSVRQQMHGVQQTLTAAVRLLRLLAGSNGIPIKEPIRTALTGLKTTVGDLADGIVKLLIGWQKLADQIGAAILPGDAALQNAALAVRDQLFKELDKVANEAGIAAAIDNCAVLMNQEFSPASPKIAPAMAELQGRLKSYANAICPALFAALDALVNDLSGLLSKPFQQLLDMLAQAQLPASVIVHELESLRDQLTHEFGEMVNRAAAAIAPLIPLPSGDNTLRLPRAWGDPPRLPNLDFLRPNLGYFDFDMLPDSISLTPVLSKVNDVLSGLNPSNIHLPADFLKDRLIPPDLKNFDLSSILPKFAGLNLNGLFSNLKLPEIANDQIKISHGEDPQSMSGWVQADVDVPYGDEPTTVFSVAGTTLRLLTARFKSTARVDAKQGQTPRSSFSGSISGNWDVTIGSLALVTITDAQLLFEDGGRFRFDLSPDKVKFQGSLQFLADALATFNTDGDGFSVRVLPTGIVSALTLDLPDVSLGTFGLANMRLGGSFELNLDIAHPDQFQVAVSAFLGQKASPFTITIFILGGAGWVDVRFTYKPVAKIFTTQVSIGIAAAASLAIALGPIKGAISAYFGITVDFSAATGAPSALTVGILILFRGEVSLLGFLSVSLVLMLEAQYTTGGGMVGRGRVSFHIKICWCFTLSVEADVQYVFSKGNSSKQLAAAVHVEPQHKTYSDYATEYVGMLG